MSQSTLDIPSWSTIPNLEVSRAVSSVVGAEPECHPLLDQFLGVCLGFGVAYEVANVLALLNWIELVVICRCGFSCVFFAMLFPALVFTIENVFSGVFLGLLHPPLYPRHVARWHCFCHRTESITCHMSYFLAFTWLDMPMIIDLIEQIVHNSKNAWQHPLKGAFWALKMACVTLVVWYFVPKRNNGGPMFDSQPHP